ncbi:MAG: ATP-dependent helicase [Hyphomicrobiales bacterium]
MINLSQNQKKAVEFKDGALLVKASAGSGKTRVLTERIKKLLENTSKKVLAITFTNKAGEEMRERLGVSENIRKQVFIGTFHSFCQRILETRGNLIGYPKMPHVFENDIDRLSLVEEAIQSVPYYLDQYNNLEEKKRESYCREALDFISKAKRQLLTNKGLYEATENKDLVSLYDLYQKNLNSQNAIDFDDLIMLTYNLFSNHPSVAALYRRSYEYICIDEAQDLNNAQYQLIRAITNGEYKNVMMVGDPNQSIYAFNGSSPDYMNSYFVNDFSPEVIELNENYRSSKRVIEAANKIMPSSINIENIAYDGIFEFHRLDDEDQEAEWICNKIEKLIRDKQCSDIEGDITYESISVLARNRFVFKSLQNLFDKREIPWYLKSTPGGLSFESNTMLVFDLALRVKINDQDDLHLRQLCDKLNLDKKLGLEELVKSGDIKEHYKVALKAVLNLKDDGSNLKGILEKFDEYIQKLDGLKDENKNIISSEIKELRDHWHRYAIKASPKSLRQFKNSMALGQTHPNTDPNGIMLSTVHTMKGQEADIVFVMGLDDGTFPDYRAIRDGGVELEQEKNNLYVAFTRSRRFLYATYPALRIMPWGDIKRRDKSRFLRNKFD